MDINFSIIESIYASVHRRAQSLHILLPVLVGLPPLLCNLRTLGVNQGRESVDCFLLSLLLSVSSTVPTSILPALARGRGRLTVVVPTTITALESTLCSLSAGVVRRIQVLLAEGLGLK